MGAFKDKNAPQNLGSFYLAADNSPKGLMATVFMLVFAELIPEKYNAEPITESIADSNEREKFKRRLAFLKGLRTLCVDANGAIDVPYMTKGFRGKDERRDDFFKEVWTLLENGMAEILSPKDVLGYIFKGEWLETTSHYIARRAAERRKGLKIFEENLANIQNGIDLICEKSEDKDCHELHKIVETHGWHYDNCHFDDEEDEDTMDRINQMISDDAVKEASEGISDDFSKDISRKIQEELMKDFGCKFNDGTVNKKPDDDGVIS